MNLNLNLSMNPSNWFSGAIDATKRQAQGTANYVNYAVGNQPVNDKDPFEIKYKQFKTYVNDVEQVNQSFQLYMDAIDTLSSAFTCLGESMAKLHRNSTTENGYPSGMENVTEIFRTIQKDIDGNVRSAVHDLMTEKCLRPIAHVLAQVPEIDQKYQRRKVVLSDHDYFKNKLQIESATTNNSYHSSAQDQSPAAGEGQSQASTTSARLKELARELALTQMEIEGSLEEFELARNSMLGPELSALVGSLYYFSTSVGCLYSQMFPLLPQSTSNFATLVAKSGVSSLPPTVLNAKSTIGTKQASYNKVQYLKSSGRYKHYIIEPTLARPDVLGGSVGGYDLLPGLYETRLREMEHRAAYAAVDNENVEDEGTHSPRPRSEDGSAAESLPNNSSSASLAAAEGLEPGVIAAGVGAGAGAGLSPCVSPVPGGGGGDAFAVQDAIMGVGGNSSTDTAPSSSFASLAGSGARSSGIDTRSPEPQTQEQEPEPETEPEAESESEPEPVPEPLKEAKEDKQEGDKVLMRVIALFDFESDEPGDLNFASGDSIEVLQQNSSGWWKGRVPLESTAAHEMYKDGGKMSYRIGVFPYNFVELESN